MRREGGKEGKLLRREGRKVVSRKGGKGMDQRKGKCRRGGRKEGIREERIRRDSV